jgi:hypothetical protein
MTYNYESEYAKKRVLQVLNNGENRIRDIQQKQKEIDKLLRNARLDLVYARTVFFGRAKGKTGKSKKPADQFGFKKFFESIDQSFGLLPK